MEKQSINDYFRERKGQFDTREMPKGHEVRFLQKLKKEETKTRQTQRVFSQQIWYGIAASIALLLAVTLGVKLGEKPKGLASVSPEMAKTQSFFDNTIRTQLKEISKEQNPVTQHLIQDAMTQLNKLESEYQRLKKDLRKSGKNQRVIVAMIANFQKRTKLLQKLLKQIKHLKNKNHETANFS